MVLSVLLWAPRLRGPIDLRYDGSVYYVLGTSLAEGKGYRLLNEPGEIEAVQYPPLLPLLVAAHQQVLGTGDFLAVGPWLRVFYALLFVGCVVAVYGIARLDLPPLWALLAALVAALALYTFVLSDMLYSELPFALMTVLFMILGRRGEGPRWFVASAVCGAAAFLLRTAGAALLAAWVAESLLRGRWKQTAARAAAALVPILLWQAHVTRVTSGPEYREPAYPYQRAAYCYSNVTYAEHTWLVHPFVPEHGPLTAAGLCRRVGANLAAMPAGAAEAVTGPANFWRWPLGQVNERLGAEVLPPWPVDGVRLLLIGLAAAGAVLQAARREWLAPLYLAASAALACLNPWPEQFARYFTPLVPFLAVALVIALRSAAGACRGRWKWAGAAFAGSVLAVLLLAQAGSLAGAVLRKRHPVSYYDHSGRETVHRLFFYDPPWSALDTALEWLRRRAGPDDVIAASVPQVAYLRTGRKAVLPPLVTDPEEARRLLDAVPVKYVVLDTLGYPGFSERYAAAAVKGCPGRWKCVYAAPGGEAEVYEREE